MVKIDFDRDALSTREAQIVEAMVHLALGLLDESNRRLAEVATRIVGEPSGAPPPNAEARTALAICGVMNRYLPGLNFRAVETAEYRPGAV